MDRDIALLEEATTAFGVRIRCYGEDLAALEDWDGGLRSRILQKHDTTALGVFLTLMEQGVMYICADPYGCHYCLFPLPPSVREGGAFYCIIGPWQESPPDDAGLAAVIRGSAIPQYLHSELAQYLAWVPQVNIHSWEALIFALVSELYGEKIQVQYADRESCLGYSGATYSLEPSDTLSIQHIEERYQNEDDLLKAVSKGDAEKAFQYMSRFSEQYEQLVPEKLRNMKIYMHILNILLRKAVENGYVHPAHIDAISMDFIRRIENAAGRAESTRIVEMMILRYCDLVKQFSLREFSPLIRNVINTVDFTFHEQLSLSSLAKQFNADSSNLSAQFKQEKGMSLTNYINSKRMEYAVSLLYSTGLYIEEIAERSGFLDVCYFNRLFKRRFGVSPTEYRKRFRD